MYIFQITFPLIVSIFSSISIFLYIIPENIYIFLKINFIICTKQTLNFRKLRLFYFFMFFFWKLTNFRISRKKDFWDERGKGRIIFLNANIFEENKNQIVSNYIYKITSLCDFYQNSWKIFRTFLIFNKRNEKEKIC